MSTRTLERHDEIQESETSTGASTAKTTPTKLVIREDQTSKTEDGELSIASPLPFGSVQVKLNQLICQTDQSEPSSPCMSTVDKLSCSDQKEPEQTEPHRPTDAESESDTNMNIDNNINKSSRAMRKRASDAATETTKKRQRVAPFQEKRESAEVPIAASEATLQANIEQTENFEAGDECSDNVCIPNTQLAPETALIRVKSEKAEQEGASRICESRDQRSVRSRRQNACASARERKQPSEANHDQVENIQKSEATELYGEQASAGDPSTAAEQSSKRRGKARMPAKVERADEPAKIKGREMRKRGRLADQSASRSMDETAVSTASSVPCDSAAGNISDEGESSAPFEDGLTTHDDTLENPSRGDLRIEQQDELGDDGPDSLSVIDSNCDELGAIPAAGRSRNTKPRPANKGARAAGRVATTTPTRKRKATHVAVLADKGPDTVVEGVPKTSAPLGASRSGSPPPATPAAEGQLGARGADLDGWRTSGSAYINARILRFELDAAGKPVPPGQRGVVAGWLSAAEADFVSEATGAPAALWRVVYDDRELGAEDLEEAEVQQGIREYDLNRAAQSRARGGKRNLPNAAPPPPSVPHTAAAAGVGADLPAAATGSARTELVARVESIADIAVRLGVNLDALVEANRPRYPAITKRCRMRAGSILTLPDKIARPPAAVGPSKAPTAAPPRVSGGAGSGGKAQQPRRATVDAVLPPRPTESDPWLAMAPDIRFPPYPLVTEDDGALAAAICIPFQCPFARLNGIICATTGYEAVAPCNAKVEDKWAVSAASSPKRVHAFCTLMQWARVHAHTRGRARRATAATSGGACPRRTWCRRRTRSIARRPARRATTTRTPSTSRWRRPSPLPVGERVAMEAPLRGFPG